MKPKINFFCIILDHDGTWLEAIDESMCLRAYVC